MVIPLQLSGDNFLGLLFLILIFGASVLGGRSFDRVKNKIFLYIFIFSIILIFSSLFYQSFRQFRIWSQDEIGRYLLPPHQSVSYFIFFVAARFFAPYLISLAMSILFLFLAKKINKKYQGRFFYPEEPYIGASAIFLIGHPGWLFYFVFLILVYLLIHLYSLFIAHSSSYRISLYHLWLPVAFFVILISRWLELLPLWGLLKI